MNEKLKESFGVYKNNFGRIFLLALPAMLVGIVCAGYPEKAIGLDSGEIKIPSDPLILCLLPLAGLAFLTMIFWNQFALSEMLNNRASGIWRCYKAGWKRMGSSLLAIKNLPKIFKGKLILILIIWFAFNAGTAFISQQILGLNFWAEKAVFNIENLVILFPFFHIYGLYLQKNIVIV